MSTKLNSATSQLPYTDLRTSDIIRDGNYFWPNLDSSGLNFTWRSEYAYHQLSLLLIQISVFRHDRLPVMNELRTSSMSRPARRRLAMNRWRHVSSLARLSLDVSSTDGPTDAHRLGVSSYTSKKSIFRCPSRKNMELSGMVMVSGLGGEHSRMIRPWSESASSWTQKHLLSIVAVLSAAHTC